VNAWDGKNVRSIREQLLPCSSGYKWSLKDGLVFSGDDRPDRKRDKYLRTTQIDSDGYFTLDRRDGRWWLITPEGDRFFNLGVNHIDPTTMHYTENIDIWRNKYRSSTQTWIKESVVPNLEKWGFNSVGWTQEVTIKNYPHSSGFSAEDYKTLDMPYCHLLPITESHQWD